ncbi:MAG: phenylalanine--tRNA ligase subunit alpha, partial [Candidatus Levybacteria bacterium]|nr:phenylalanine--tRNA ligase subunit alpha [Candidatus Levybacteria bacterium]
MENELMNIKNNAVSLILDAKNNEDLDEIKLQFLGRSGALTVAMKEIALLPIESRPEMGKLANEVKSIIEDAMKSAKGSSHEKKIEQIKKIDVTDPGIRPPLGHLHLVTQAIADITKIFESIGFQRVSHPEVEWDWYAFGALNFPDNHPARDDWETFFIEQEADKKYGPVLLTPHTSSGQIREMEKKVFPIKMLNIAKTYRRQSDVSHVPMFHQFETLVIGENMSITHLKGVLDYFVKAYFGPERKSRIRPYHFQFTEPSFETDLSCGVCNGTSKLPNGDSCRLCKEGWLELGGAGMVHPNVIKNVGLDPEKYSGFASGWGVERVLTMKEGLDLDDLRLLYANDLDFLEQF